MPPDPEPPAGQPEGETLARFAVLLAAHRGQAGQQPDPRTPGARRHQEHA